MLTQDENRDPGIEGPDMQGEWFTSRNSATFSCLPFRLHAFVSLMNTEWLNVPSIALG